MRLIGVYDADGSVRGELAYLFGTLTGGSHCALCDITHGRFGRKASFDAACAALPVPLELLHRDELEPGLAALLGGRLPCVAIVDGATVEVVLDRAALEACAGSPDAFARALAAAL